MMRAFVIFVLGTIFGAILVLSVVLLQWHFPGKLGPAISWLPSATVSQVATSPGSIRALPPVAAPASSGYPEQVPGNAILVEPSPIVWPPVMPEVPAEAAPAKATVIAAEDAASGELLIPVTGIKASQLSDTFNDSRGNARVHDAIDIMAPKGTAVLAVNDGKIVKLFNSKQGGLTIYQFNPGETHAYYYAHLDSYASGVKEGNVIKRGDVIGYVGSTGNASPDAPHLHFAIFVLGPEKKWWQGTAMNPYPLLGGK